MTSSYEKLRKSKGMISTNNAERSERMFSIGYDYFHNRLKSCRIAKKFNISSSNVSKITRDYSAAIYWKYVRGQSIGDLSRVYRLTNDEVVNAIRYIEKRFGIGLCHSIIKCN